MVFVIATLYFPFLVFLIIPFIISFLRLNEVLLKAAFCTFVPIFFASISAMKFPESDLLVYVEAISIISNKGFLDVLSFKYVSLRSTEFIFNYYIWLISFIDESGWLFSFLSTYIIYLNVSLSLCNIFTVKKNETLYLIVAMLLFSITFSLVGHLVRQYLAASFLLLGISYLDSRKKLGVSLLVSSIFIHSSMFLFVLAFPFVRTLLSTRLWAIYTFLLLFLAAIIGLFSSYLMPYMEVAFAINDGSIPIPLIFFDVSLFSLFFYFKIKSFCIDKRIVNIYCLSVLLICCLLVSREISLLFFRFYFIADFIRPFLIIFLSTAILNKNILKSLFIYVALIFSFLIFIIRFESNPWDYGVGAFSFLFDSTILDILDRYVDM